MKLRPEQAKSGFTNAHTDKHQTKTQLRLYEAHHKRARQQVELKLSLNAIHTPTNVLQLDKAGTRVR